MSFLSRAFEAPKEERILTSAGWVSSNIPSPWVDQEMYGGGGFVPEGSPMALGAFYACVTLLADIISSLSVSAYRWKNGAEVKVNPQPLLFENSPYPGLTWFGWLWMLLESMAVTGNGFTLVTARGTDDRPIALMPVHPDFMNIDIPAEELTGLQWPDPIYHINGVRVKNDNIVHIKRYPIAGAGWGMSPVGKAATSIGLGLAADKYGLRYFRDAANPSGILSTDQDLTPEQVKQTQKNWLKSQQGRRLPAVMSGGLKWTPVTLTPEESQFLGTRSFQVGEIARWFRIPPHMIGDTEKSTSWGTGIEEMTLGFVKYTLTPWLSCIEQALTALLPRGVFAKFNIDDLLRGDIESRWAAYQLGRNTGAYSVNDILAMEHRPKIGSEGDIRLQPVNYVPLGTNPALLAAANAGGDSDSEDSAPTSAPKRAKRKRKRRQDQITRADNADGEDKENNDAISP